MAKLLIIALLAIIGCKLLSGRWPWQLMRGPARSSPEAEARALLGLGKSAGRDEIIGAHRRLVTRVHPDKGGTGEQVLQANAARDLLLGRLSDTRQI